MIYVIFDNVLTGHTWSEVGGLQIVPPELPARSFQPSSPEAERRSLLARLAARAKSEPIMCRAARRLVENPSMQLDQLAFELGISERYLVAGLRSVLGVNPELLVMPAKVRLDAA
jgi:AraC-like DNA-binding protein